MDSALEIDNALLAATAEGIAPNFERWARFAGVGAGEWIELQALGVRSSYGERTRFAHADSLRVAVALLTEAERFQAAGSYVIANRVNDAVATRREPRKWHDALKGQSTTDRDVLARRVLLIDIDAKRPSGTSATDDEIAATILVASAIRERLARAFGPCALGLGHSGNGRQVHVALEQVPESESVAATVRAFLAALSARYATDAAHVDVGVFDAKRLVPAFGTRKRKGAPGIAERPHRLTGFLCADTVIRAPLDRIVGVTAEIEAELGSAAPRAATREPVNKPTRRAPRPPRTATTAATARPFERANALAVEDVAAWLGLCDDGDVRCPGCGNTSGVAFVNNGLKCLHNSCARKGAPRNPGFRTPVDLVVEVRQIGARDAVSALAMQFGFEGFTSRAAPPPETPRPATHGASDPGGERRARPRIFVTPDEKTIADSAVAALAEGSADIYERAGALVRVLPDDDRPRIASVAPATLRELLADHIEWFVRSTKKDEVVEEPVHPPRWCVEAVHARGHWQGVRPLRCVVEFPLLRPDGTVLDTPGYDPATQVLFVSRGTFEPVPERITRADAEQACAALLDVFQDFPFRADANRAACIAALLTPFARHAFDGAVPAVLIDGTAPGAGKGLIANVLGLIVTGRELDVRSEVDNEDELRKRIMSIARTGDPLVLIDNVTRPLGGGALDAALTARRSWSDRGMGTFDEVRAPMVATWIFTGNNIEFRRRDTKRRCLHVRLEAEDANPENRQGFRHHPLLAYVEARRTALVAAALTILRGYILAGRPVAPLPQWGSFDEWSALVRQAVVWCGLPDPYDARAGLDEADPETVAAAALLEGWEEIARDLGGAKKACTASDALDALRDDDLSRTTIELRRHPPQYAKLRLALAELIPTPPGVLPSVHRLGTTLRRMRGRVVGGKKLACSLSAGSNVWSVVSVGLPKTAA